VTGWISSPRPFQLIPYFLPFPVLWSLPPCALQSLTPKYATSPGSLNCCGPIPTFPLQLPFTLRNPIAPLLLPFYLSFPPARPVPSDQSIDFYLESPRTTSSFSVARSPTLPPVPSAPTPRTPHITASFTARTTTMSATLRSHASTVLTLQSPSPFPPFSTSMTSLSALAKMLPISSVTS